MLLRCFYTAVFASTLIVGAATVARAECGTGYNEHFTQKGEPYCVPAARDRVNQLRQAQRMLRFKNEWLAKMVRDRQARLERDAQIEQRRREQALN